MIFQKVEDGYSYITFSNGISYSGEIKNKALNGEGRLNYSDGRSFEGTFLNNRKHG